MENIGPDEIFIQALLDEYAQSKFDACIVDENESCKIPGIDTHHVNMFKKGYNICRSEIISRWNNQTLE
jgi:hypothetical protein